MTETNAPAIEANRSMLPKRFAVPLVVGLFLLFVFLNFPWDSLTRRLAFEISAASGSRVSIQSLAPAWTARGPVLRAREVTIEHPAVNRVRLHELEVAPRWSTGWLFGDPRLRVWADSDMGVVDGVLDLDDTPSYRGAVERVELSRLPLRVDTSGLRLSGRLDADTDVSLDPKGTLSGRVAFESPSLVIESDTLPMAIPFSRADGVIVILESGATQIESVNLEGEVVSGRLSGEIGLVHRSQSPPIDLEANLRIVDPTLRRLAPNAGFVVSPAGDVAVRLGGTIDAPEVGPLRGSSAANRARRATP